MLRRLGGNVAGGRSFSKIRPPPPLLKKAPDSAAWLTQQLEQKDAELRPTQEQADLRNWLDATLKPLLEKHSGGTFHTFGSCQNGFWMNGSDIDACLVMPKCLKKQSWLTKLRLARSLAITERLGQVELVEQARVPVAKIHDGQGRDLCDVSVNNVAALENSRFVGAMSGLDWRIPCLGRFIKHWASQRRINNRSEGTLSTYTLILQLFYSLQLRDPPVLPLVTDILKDSLPEGAESSGTEAPKAVNHFLSEPEMDESTGQLRSLPVLTDPAMIKEDQRFPQLNMNQESLGELLLAFFELWGREEFGGGEDGDGQTVYVYDATQELNDLGILVMRCPLTGKNVNPFTTVVWRSIHAEFARAASLLQAGCSLEELCEPAEGLPPGCGHRGGGLGAEIAAALSFTKLDGQ